MAAQGKDLLLPGRQCIQGLLKALFVLAGEDTIVYRIAGGIEQSSHLTAEGHVFGHVLEEVEHLISGYRKEPAVKSQETGKGGAVLPDLEEDVLDQFLRKAFASCEMERIGIDLFAVMMEYDAKSGFIALCDSGKQIVLIRQR